MLFTDSFDDSVFIQSRKRTLKCEVIFKWNPELDRSSYLRVYFRMMPGFH
jgi:hypothetical protein